MNQLVDLKSVDQAGNALPIGELASKVVRRWKRLVLLTVSAGALAYGLSYLIAPTFTSRVTFLPPQQQGSASSALASLGALGALAGLGGMGGKTTADQYVAFMQSNRVLDEIIDKYKLIEVYDVKFRSDARKELLDFAKIAVGKKDGLITVNVEDKDPVRAASIANDFIAGLRSVTNTLAVSEAQQRRLFFFEQLNKSKESLIQAQVALQSSGFDSGALRAEPKAAAEGFARVRAELTAAEIKLRSLRQLLSDQAPEVLQQVGVVASLRSALAKVEQKDSAGGDAQYVSKYREFKYQETLFELFAKQYELARVDESREGSLIQVLDAATPAERRSKPKRALITLGAMILALVVQISWIVARDEGGRT